MKIALIVPGGVDRSGTHRVVPALLWHIERLAREHEVHVVALRQEPRPGRWGLLGAEVHNVGARPRRLRALAALAAEHRRGPFEVLHAVWAIPQGVVGAVARAALGAPLVVELAGGEMVSLPELGFGGARNWRGRAWLRAALAAADRVVVHSRPMQEAAARWDRPDALLLPPGVPLDRWPLSPPRPRLPDRPLRLLHVGTLNRVKDQGTLLDAVARLAQGGTPFHLDVVGEDTLGGAVQRRAAELGVGGRVTFHGFLPHEALRPLYDQAHLLVVSSRHEAGPVVALEAAAAGIAVVGTAVGYLAEWAPGAARVVPPGDAAVLAAALEELARDDPARRALARAAQERVRLQDADHAARRFSALYADLASGGAPARPSGAWASGRTRTSRSAGRGTPTARVRPPRSPVP